MDGNSRWSKIHELSTEEGHARGAEVARNIIKYAVSIKLEELTLYAFSYENWSRPSGEIQSIIALLNHYITNFIDEFMQHNIVVKFLGDLNMLDDITKSNISQIMNFTSINTGLKLNIAFSY
ncbi:unnamed protein product, partial [Sphagnum jensenii]